MSGFAAAIGSAGASFAATRVQHRRTRNRSRRVRALYADDEDQLAFAPISKGDGFSFYGGKYSAERDKTDDWWDRGNFAYAYMVKGARRTAKDPLFGLKLGAQSQVSAESYRWFYVEEGGAELPALLLLHGLGSQAYSFRNVMPLLSSKYRTIAVDWLGFGFSDKPQAGYGFSYTFQEYAKALEALIAAYQVKPVHIVVQGHFAPAVIHYALRNQDKVSKLILINPPVEDKLPSSVLSFANPFLGDIFVQDPYKASDGVLTQAGYYSIAEEDKMVYRKPYLTSGSAGFALASVAKVWKKELKEEVANLWRLLSLSEWNISTLLIGGVDDKWVKFSKLENIATSARLKLVSLSEVGHHAQEDYAQGVAEAIMAFLA